MATSERPPRSTHATADSTESSAVGGAGMAHLTVVPTNFEESTVDERSV